MTGSCRRSARATSPCGRARAATAARRAGLRRRPARLMPAPGRRRAGDRPALPSALRRGLRHLALRRGVAVGVDRHRVPAAARRARPRPGRPPLTLSLTPVLCDQLEEPGAIERCADFLADDARRDPPPRHRGRRGGGRRGRRRRARALGGALRVGARAAGRLAGGGGGPARRARPPRRVDLLGDPRDPAAAGHRRGRAPAAAHAASPRTAPASVQAGWRGGLLARPSAPTRRGWTGCSRRPACAPSASTSPTCSTPAEHLRPLRAPAGPLLVPIDRATIELVWSRGGYPADPRYRSYHAFTRASPPRVEQRRRALRPGPRRRGGPRARRGLRRPRARAGGGRRPVRARGRHRAVRRLVARGAAVAGGGARRGGAAQGLPIAHLDDALDAPRARAVPAPARRPARHLVGNAARPDDLERAAGRRHGVERPRRRAAHASPPPAPAPPTSAPSASCSRCRQATGRFSSAPTSRRPTGIERAAHHRAALDAALADPGAARRAARAQPRARGRRRRRSANPESETSPRLQRALGERRALLMLGQRAEVERLEQRAHVRLDGLDADHRARRRSGGWRPARRSWPRRRGDRARSARAAGPRRPSAPSSAATSRCAATRGRSGCERRARVRPSPIASPSLRRMRPCTRSPSM